VGEVQVEGRVRAVQEVVVREEVVRVVGWVMGEVGWVVVREGEEGLGWVVVVAGVMGSAGVGVAANKRGTTHGLYMTVPYRGRHDMPAVQDDKQWGVCKQQHLQGFDVVAD
jgi:hypothetical protein